MVLKVTILRAENCVKYNVVTVLWQHVGGPQGVDDNPRTILHVVALVPDYICV